VRVAGMGIKVFEMDQGRGNIIVDITHEPGCCFNIPCKHLFSQMGVHVFMLADSPVMASITVAFS